MRSACRYLRPGSPSFQRETPSHSRLRTRTCCRSPCSFAVHDPPSTSRNSLPCLLLTGIIDNDANAMSAALGRQLRKARSPRRPETVVRVPRHFPGTEACSEAKSKTALPMLGFAFFLVFLWQSRWDGCCHEPLTTLSEFFWVVTTARASRRGKYICQGWRPSDVYGPREVERQHFGSRFASVVSISKPALSLAPLTQVDRMRLCQQGYLSTYLDIQLGQDGSCALYGYMRLGFAFRRLPELLDMPVGRVTRRHDMPSW
ncbi:hypothetical protein BDP55DRAFT_48879 [Colletotrichum godetiae]|uniref:Uncharacterized protein n=1 Tax=Colletotrichum godetiae TaxID=1209918 RepID=A0AAJ0F0J2_9PEZI|nr:uncharacterized protein BDP55DRAFT_48879 [Colletotrichum godetiae]KAK1688573.1 hypothetical protein BDP55DRAFT_48879 [Colletotrichum godetiae]